MPTGTANGLQRHDVVSAVQSQNTVAIGGLVWTTAGANSLCLSVVGEEQRNLGFN